MTYVESFDPAMIETAARALGLNYATEPDGYLVACFAAEELGMSLILEATAEANSRVCAVRIRGGRYLERDDWPRTLGLINRWNVEHRWPRAYVDNQSGGQCAAVVCDAQLPVSQGVHQELINELLANTLECTFRFWTWLIPQLPPQEERWKGADMLPFSLPPGDDADA